MRVIHGAEFCVYQFVDRPPRLRIIAVLDNFVETSGVPAPRQGNTNGIWNYNMVDKKKAGASYSAVSSLSSRRALCTFNKCKTSKDMSRAVKKPERIMGKALRR